jgi:hypothetical protein
MNTEREKEIPAFRPLHHPPCFCRISARSSVCLSFIRERFSSDKEVIDNA